jgi:molecular chaperone DnaK
MYNASQAQGGQPQGDAGQQQQSSGDNKGGDDEVTDVDFEEVK